jgi:hypothetical protein
MAGTKRIETPTMQMISERLKNTDGRDLRTYLEQRRAEMVDQGDGTQVRATWDDLAFWIRTVTGKRVVRESVRNWADRYGIKDPEHDYGVDADAMPDGTPEPAEA